MAFKIIVDSVDYLYRDGRIDEVGCAYFDGTCTTEQELDGIGGIHDSAESDDRDLDGIVGLPYATQGYWLDCCSTQSACNSREHRTLSFGIDCHCKDGIDE